MAAALQFRDVTLGYDRHPAVHHLSGEVGPGALLAIVGPNGAGKSTLFRGIVGILKPLAGTIITGGLDIRDIAYLPQTVDIDRSFPISVFDLVGTGLWRATGFFGGMGKRDHLSAEQSAALECREAHGAGGAARHGSGARQFPRNPAAGAREGRLGRDRRRPER